MTWRDRQAALSRLPLWLVCLPLALGVMVQVKGIVQLLTFSGAGYDLNVLWTASQYYLRGINPFPAAIYVNDLQYGIVAAQAPRYVAEVGWPWMVNYPPSSILTQLIVFGLPFAMTRVVYVAINVISAGTIAWWASTTTEGERPRLLFAGLAILNLGYAYTITVGNYAVMVTAALAASWMLRRRHPVIGGLLLGVALVKPTISLPFALLFLAERRYTALAVTAGYLAASCVLAVVLTGDSLGVLFAQMLEGSSRWAIAGYGLAQLLRWRGVPEALALSLAALPFLIPFACLLWPVWRRREECPLALLAVAAVVARLFTYHNDIDNVIVMFLVIALARLAILRGTGAAAWWAASAAASVMLPYALTNSGLIHALLYFTWAAAAGYAVWAGANTPAFTERATC